MKFLPKIFLASLAVACIAILLMRCEKQTDESSAVVHSNTSAEGSSAESVSDRNGLVTSCIECDLEWRFLCDQTRCDGGVYTSTSVTLDGDMFREDGGDGTCCVDNSSTVTWMGAPSVSQWLSLNPGVLKSSVYPALNPGFPCAPALPMLNISALVSISPARSMPGRLKIQFRKKGDTAGTTITQHNIPLYPGLAPCITDAVTPILVPITVENNCRVASSYMVTPETIEPYPVYCPQGEGGGH